MKNWTIQMNEDNMDIFNGAEWRGFNVTRHERYADGTYLAAASDIPNVFLSGNKLYYPSFAPFTFTVTSLIPLNMNKDDETCGVYFSVTKVE